MVTLLSVCALTYLRSTTGAAVVDAAISKIHDPSTASQMRVPIALSHLLPIGLKGMLLSICLMGIIAGDGIHLHSWSSLLIQDVIVPLRRKPLSVKQHLLLLRIAVIGVAVFAFVFGAVFPQTEYVQIWWAITQAVYTGGVGAAIIGGLYWSRGTTPAAWVAFFVGSMLSVGGIITRIYFQKVIGHEFFLNGQQIGFFASVAAVLCYVVISVLTCRQPHDMDRLLHRGRYAIEPDVRSESTDQTKKRVPLLHRIIGIDEQFNQMDRWITIGIFVWSMFWFAVFVIGSVAYLLHPWSNTVWANYWLITAIFLPLVIGLLTTIWFTIGCWQDMRVFFRRLRGEKLDEQDDGTVSHPPTNPH